MGTQKRFSELGQAENSYRDEIVNIHTSERRMNANDRLKNLSFFSQNASLLDASQLASTTLLEDVFKIFEFNLLHKLHPGISMLRKECSFKFLGSAGVMGKFGSI